MNKIGTLASVSMSMAVALSSPCLAADPPRDYPVSPVPFTRVKVEGGFWAPRFETNRVVTIPYDFKKCEETGRIANFAKAGGLIKGEFQGIPFDDSDVFKVIEGASYSAALHPDPELDGYLDGLIAKIAAAQEPDGYLYTARRLLPPEKMPGMSGKTRWLNEHSSHELYNVGHLYEAAVAHFQATGKRTLLDVAIRNADLIVQEFQPGKQQNPPGHEEIEIGLVKLHRVTGDAKYLALARFLLDLRGRAETHALYGAQCQDHKPVVAQDEAVGHAVRAGYLYSGMADVAALTGDAEYVHAIDRIWDNVVTKKLYLTGGIGARHGGEAFGDNYELPNKSAYNETCAAIANALWNHRMFLLHGDAKYIDVLERVLYNGFLSGVAMSGDRFFYPNPLASSGGYERSPWFGCACCPVNVVRFIPSIAGYAYAARGNRLYVNLFIAGSARADLNGRTVEVVQDTKYPWDGNVRITVNPQTPGPFTVMLRIPGWAQGRPVPGDLYSYLGPDAAASVVKVNGKPFSQSLDKGYLEISNDWKKGDVIEAAFPMIPRRAIANEAVKDDIGRVAVERGPLVYCAEGVDNDGRVLNFLLPDDAALKDAFVADLLGGVTVLRARGARVLSDLDGKRSAEPADITLVPYYAWCHRGAGPMTVWMARTPEAAEAARAGLHIAASHCYENDTVDAVADGVVPRNSIDHSIPRFTWWPRKGGAEWIEVSFDKPRTFSSAEVYWFDDTGRGECRVPAGWKLLVRDGDAWKPVASKGGHGVAKDAWNRIEFDPVSAAALRIEAQLQEGFSGGILEWRLAGP
jgi:uncharacterized protein